ncbi:MAG: CAP domain-containing protein [Marinomonas sp.]
MLKQASIITSLVAVAAVAAGPMWPDNVADARELNVMTLAHEIVPAAPDAVQLSPRYQTLLDTHNGERKVFGSSALTWSPKLAGEAQKWADDLAKRDVMEHASFEIRGGAGENIWVGTRGRYTTKQMIDAFIAEKSDFKPGKFPKVTKSGNWADVGHYTQLVWPETKEVGCAIAENRMDEFLVCRYWPAGNIRGVQLGK